MPSTPLDCFFGQCKVLFVCGLFSPRLFWGGGEKHRAFDIGNTLWTLACLRDGGRVFGSVRRLAAVGWVREWNTGKGGRKSKAGKTKRRRGNLLMEFLSRQLHRQDRKSDAWSWLCRAWPRVIGHVQGKFACKGILVHGGKTKRSPIWRMAVHSVESVRGISGCGHHCSAFLFLFHTFHHCRSHQLGFQPPHTHHTPPGTFSS